MPKTFMLDFSVVEFHNEILEALKIAKVERLGLERKLHSKIHNNVLMLPYTNNFKERSTLLSQILWAAAILSVLMVAPVNILFYQGAGSGVKRIVQFLEEEIGV